MSEEPVPFLPPRQLLDLMVAHLPGLSRFVSDFAMPEPAEAVAGAKKKNPSPNAILVRLGTNLARLGERAQAGLDETPADVEPDIPVLFASSAAPDQPPVMGRATSDSLAEVRERAQLTGQYDRTYIMLGRKDLMVNFAATRAFVRALSDNVYALGHDSHPAIAALGAAGGSEGALKNYEDTLGRALVDLGAVYNQNAVINAKVGDRISRPLPLRYPQHMFISMQNALLRKVAKTDPGQKDVVRHAFASAMGEGVRMFEDSGVPPPPVPAGLAPT
jgi:hypothetical protein